MKKEIFTVRLDDFESAELDELIAVRMPNEKDPREIRKNKLWLVKRLLAEAIHAHVDFVRDGGTRVPSGFSVNPTTSWYLRQFRRRMDRMRKHEAVSAALAAANVLYQEEAAKR